MKSELEIRFDALVSEYENKFDVPYVIMIGSPLTLEEHIKTIQDAIDRSEPVARERISKDIIV